MTALPPGEGVAAGGDLQDISYAWRPNFRASVESFTLTRQGIVTQHGGVMSFDNLASLRLYSVPGIRSLVGPLAQPRRICIVTSSAGQKVRFGSLSFLAPGRFEDRLKLFDGFVESLVSRARTVDPSVPVWLGMPPATWWSWMLTFATLTATLTLTSLLGLFGLALQHDLSWMTGGVLVAMLTVAFMLGSFVRATWRCRSRPAGENMKSG